MVKSKVLYQTKLILDTFPKEDYELITKDTTKPTIRPITTSKMEIPIFPINPPSRLNFFISNLSCNN